MAAQERLEPLARTESSWHAELAHYALDNVAHNIYSTSMAQRDLSRELEEARRELTRVTALAEPLIAYRDALRRRVASLEELAAPLRRPEAALRRATRATEQVPPATRSLPAADLDARRFLFEFDRALREDGLGNPPGSEPGLDAGRIIADILEDAGRPLHREEIYQRGRRHPLGPLNRSTMVTRLSKDRGTFENLGGDERTGYWALRSWADEKKRIPADTDAGRGYSELLARFDREVQTAMRATTVRRHHEAAYSALRERLLRESDSERATELRAQVRRAEVRWGEADQEARRRIAITRSLWVAAREAREALGVDEATKYPKVPDWGDLGPDFLVDQRTDDLARQLESIEVPAGAAREGGDD